MEIAIFKNLELGPGKSATLVIQIERKLSICQCRGFFMKHGGDRRATKGTFAMANPHRIGKNVGRFTFFRFLYLKFLIGIS